jgi:hypothetical protein
LKIFSSFLSYHSISFALQEASAANLRSRPAFGTLGLFDV